MEIVMAGIILLVILLCLVFWFIATSNRFKVMKVKIEEARASIEIALIKRYDVLSQSVKIVKNYSEHESDIFKSLIKVRRGADINELNDAAASQAKALDRFYAVGEAYPELKTDNLYTKLQTQLSEENEMLAAAKRMYNGNVSEYNQSIIVFPASIVASMSGCIRKEFFKEENLDKAKNFELDL